MAKAAMTREELYRSLAGWDVGSHDRSQNEALEARLWAELGRDRAVLVTDLSGFTRISRSRGILHFLAVFHRAHGIGDALIPGHGGRFLKSAADNLFALFDTVGAAAACARAMHAAAGQHNAGVANEDGQVRFCIGIGWGRLIELADDAFGDAVNVAFKLGEDVAEPGEILLTEPAVEELARAPEQRELHAALHGPIGLEIGRVPLRYWKLRARE